MLPAVRFLIAGRVQGVFYRASAARLAGELGVSGWVRNLADGRVELVARGGPEAIEQLAVWLWRGPEQAEVEAVDQEAFAGDVAEGFRIEP